MSLSPMSPPCLRLTWPPCSRWRFVESPPRCFRCRAKALARTSNRIPLSQLCFGRSADDRSAQRSEFRGRDNGESAGFGLFFRVFRDEDDDATALGEAFHRLAQLSVVRERVRRIRRRWRCPRGLASRRRFAAAACPTVRRNGFARRWSSGSEAIWLLRLRDGASLRRRSTSWLP